MYYIREQLAAKVVVFQYVHSKYQVMNILIKPLATIRFEMLKSKLNVTKIYAQDAFK